MKGDLFSVDEHGLTADGYHSLNPLSKKSMYVSRVVALVLTGLIVFAIVYYIGTLDDVPSWYGTVLTILFVLLAAWSLISPQIFYRRYRYRFDDEKVEIRRGVIIITHEMVPIERIHQVNVSAGPVNRMFDLADITITTAGGVVKLQFLDADVAESIAGAITL